MAEQQQNPFELVPQQQPKAPWSVTGGAPPWAGITPQDQGGPESGYFQQVDPAVAQMMWAPQMQPAPLPPPVQPPQPPPPLPPLV